MWFAGIRLKTKQFEDMLVGLSKNPPGGDKTRDINMPSGSFKKYKERLLCENLEQYKNELCESVLA